MNQTISGLACTELSKKPCLLSFPITKDFRYMNFTSSTEDIRKTLSKVRVKENKFMSKKEAVGE